MTDPDAPTGSEHPDHRGDGGGGSVPYGSDPGASEDARTTRPYPSSGGYETAYGQQPLGQRASYGQQPPYGSVSGAYAPQPGEFAPPRGLSITSFVLGMVSLLFWFSLLVPIAGLVLGFAGLRREPAGRGFAIAGIIINGVFVLLAVFAIVFVLLLFLGALGSIPFFLDQTGTGGLPA